MSKQSNPAERLYSILDQARRHQQGSALQIWAEVFEIDLDSPEGTRKAIRQIALMHDLVEDIRGKIRAMDTNQNLYLRRFDKIEQAIKVDQLGAGWNSFSAHLDEATMINLEHCSELLSKSFAENDIQDEIIEIKQQVDNLCEEVLASALSEDVKAFILDELEIIRRGIAEYRIRGAQGLREALATNIGNIWLNKNMVATEANAGVVKRFGKILLDIDRCTAAAMRLKALTVTIVKALGFPG